MSNQEHGELTPFITAYGEFPLVVLTEFAGSGGQVCARVVRPRELNALGSGSSWDEAHWALFNALLSDYMNLDRNRTQLGPARQQQLFQLDCLRDDGTLRLIASIARSGFPPGLQADGSAAPPRVELPSGQG